MTLLEALETYAAECFGAACEHQLPAVGRIRSTAYEAVFLHETFRLKGVDVKLPDRIERGRALGEPFAGGHKEHLAAVKCILGLHQLHIEAVGQDALLADSVGLSLLCAVVRRADHVLRGRASDDGL